MKLHNIDIIAGYEVKLLRRSWLFRIFAFLTLAGIAGYTLWKQTYIIDTYNNIWPQIALPSLMPLATTYYYNLAQSVIVIFLAGSFLKRDRKLDTAEVIYVRPISNADYIAGKSLGIIRVFLSLNVIVLAVTAVLNTLVNHSPFSIWPYLFYLATISLPSLIFVLGLSFTLMCLLKNQAVTLILMLGAMSTVFFYLPDEAFGLFDFFGLNIPAVFSEVCGHPSLGRFLLQRSIYLVLGTGLITLTAALVQRMPHKPWKKRLLFMAAGGFFLAAVTAGILYTGSHTRQLARHRTYAGCYNEYASRKNVHLLSQELEIIPHGCTMEGKSRIRMHNPYKESLQEYYLFLNPDLSVVSVSAGGRPLPFDRDRQAVCIHHRLAAGDTATLEIGYRGGIDEEVCYTDVPETEYMSTKFPKGFFRYGKRYAWLEEDYVLLTPECLWYPTAIAPAHPASPYQLKKNFSLFSLKVVYKGGMTVLSQGYAERKGDTVCFTNRHALPGISLTLGAYESLDIKVDSTEYQVFHFKGHDYFSRYFTALKDTLPGLIREMRSDFEIRKDRDYPSHKFVVAETPVQFSTYIRNWKGYTENIMPEILFFPERGALINADFRAATYRNRHWNRRRQGEPDETEIASTVLRNFVKSIFTEENIKQEWGRKAEQFVNPYNIIPMFLHHTSCITSEDYPVLDVVLNLLQNTDESRTGFNPWRSTLDNSHKANLYLDGHSLKDALSDQDIPPTVLYELLKLKSIALKNYIYTRINPVEFDRFLKNFFERNRFSNIPFRTFQREIETVYGLDLNHFLYHWYMDKETPALYIRDVDASQVVIGEETRYRISFKVSNPSATDALVTSNVQIGEFRWGRGQKNRKGRRDDNQIGHWSVPAGKSFEIRIICDDRPSNITVNTNISRNLPNAYTFNFPKIGEECTDSVPGIFPVLPDTFRPDPKEIVIDNEDSGFRIISSNNRHKLKDMFRKEDQEKYKDMSYWWFPSKWTLVAAGGCYGDVVSSAFYKKKGRGNNAAEWKADISREGYYEVYIWNPRQEELSKMMRRHGHQEGREQIYTVTYGEEEESVILDLEKEAPGWISIGHFYLMEGTVKIVLTDKTDGYYVIADAVKLTELE